MQTQIITKDDEESKKQLLLMQEQLAANQREMVDMEKSWEQKLEEAREKEKIRD